ncbi:MAG: serine/threonine protein kinase [Panacagrimonas sp.]
MNPGKILEKGWQIENFTIQRKLGRGGFGVTYLATEFARSSGVAQGGTFQRDVAIKEFFPEGLAWRAEQSRVIPAQREGAEVAFIGGLKAFMREANTIAQLDHQNVVRIYSVFESHGTAYFVMPYLQGMSLKGWLRQRRTLTQVEIERVVLPVLDGLEEVHGVGVIHRDLKPDNIMIREGNQRPVLIDFGAARVKAADDAQQYTRISELVAYTPGYAPIEQYARATSDNRHGACTDLYAFCATLYECVTGAPPPESALRSLDVQSGRPDPMPPASRDRSASGAYSEGLLAAIDWGLAIIPEHRPQTVTELRDCINGLRPVPPRAVTQLTMVLPPREQSAPALAVAASLEPRTPSRPLVPATTQPVLAESAPGPIEAAATQKAATRSSRWPLIVGAIAAIGVLAGIAMALLPGPRRSANPAQADGVPALVTPPEPAANAEDPASRQRALDAREQLQALLMQMDAALSREEAPASVLGAARDRLAIAETAFAAGDFERAIVGFEESRRQAASSASSYLTGLRGKYATLATRKLDAGDTRMAEMALNRAKEIDGLLRELK